MRVRTLVASGLTVFAIGLAACSPQPAAAPEQEAAAPAEAAPSYVPGLGEIMTLQQMRHTKLWFAGEAENWPLASYELVELNEGFEDVATFHPTHEGVDLPIPDLIEKIVKEPLNRLDQAVQSEDRAAFEEAYDGLTQACNSCHEAANFGFNVVQRPASNPYPNQNFEPQS